MAERLRVEDSSVQEEGRMEKGTHGGMGDDLRPEYDLSRLLRGSVRGKYAERFIALDANTSSPTKTGEVAVQKPTDTSASTAINDESSIENGDGLSPTALLLRAMVASMDEQGNVKGSMLHDTMRRIVRWDVTAATIVMGLCRLAMSFCKTRAGRVLRISAPIVGSKLTR